MNHVIVQPSGGKNAKKHYADTNEESVPLSQIEPFVAAAVMDELQHIYPHGGALVWGVVPGKKGGNANEQDVRVSYAGGNSAMQSMR